MIRINGKLLILLFLFSPFFLGAQCPDVNATFSVSQQHICGPGAQTITFANVSSGANAGTANYEWFLDGVSFDNTVGLAAPSNSNISAIGTYEYMLVATDPTVPCTDTAIVIVNIYNTPNANFNFGPDGDCGNIPVNFANTSTGTQAGTNFTWNFGDGSPVSNVQSPTHNYNAGGTFNVTLTVTNGPGCSDVANATVTTLPIPNPAIAGDDGDGDLINCLLPADPTTAQTVTFSNTTTGAVQYTWDFGDGSPPVVTGSLADIDHTYTSYGTFTVTMTAEHANGCTASETLTVVFEKFVSAAMTLDITEYSGCAPHDLSTLTNLSVNANSYVWDFGDGTVLTSTDPNPPSHFYLQEGTYTISLTAINSCNMANATISPIVIVEGPTTNFASGLAGNLGCAPQNVNPVNNSTNVSPANNYQWDMGNGNTYTNMAVPPTQTYDTTGVYTIMLVAGNACGNDTMWVDITIDTIPVVEIVSDPLDDCSPLTVQTTNNSYEPPINYTWFVDGVFQGTMVDLPDQTFINTGTNVPQNHTIQLNGSNHCGNDSDSETIIVHPETQAIFTASTDTICEGESITYTDGSFGEALTYEWDFGITTETTQGPHTVTYPTAGNHTIELIVDGYCGPDTATFDIVVLPIPVADITADVDTGCVGLDITFTNNSTLGGTYLWDFDNGIPASSSLYSPAPVDYPNAGPGEVILYVDVLGCTNSDTIDVLINPLPVPTFTLTPNDGCTPLEVAINNTSPNNPLDNYDWDFGNGNTFSGYSPANETYIALNNDSIYTVQLVITSEDGCIDSLSQTLTVHPLPIADYIPLPDTACAGDPIGFLNNSIGATSYLWDFGDGTTSTQVSPSHAYTLTGDITTQLIAYTGFGCTDTLEIEVYVDSIPTADFVFDIVCEIDTTHFTDLSTGGITEWQWDFGDGSPLDNNQDPEHFYGAAGNYNVTLTVTNPAGCDISVSQLVGVSTVPVADFTFGGTCLNELSQFTDNSSGIATSWEWDFGDGSPIDNNQHPGHLYTATGTYDVQMIAMAGNGCSDTITIPITITGIPTADFAAASVCTNDTTFFTDVSTGGPDFWEWDFDDGNTSNLQDPDHVYTVAGTYNVMLVAGYLASGCTDTIVYTIDAYPRTIPDFSTNTPCLGASTDFTDETTGTPTLWTWDFGDGSPIDNSQHPTHVYGSPGIFNVELITENAFACVDTFTTTVEVYPLPVADFTFDVVCLNATTSFNDLSTNAVAWEWDFGDGTGFDLNPSPTHAYSSAGNFDVRLVVTNADGCTDTLIQTITVNPNPTADFIASTACHTYPSFFTDNSANAILWTWDFGDGSPLDNNQSPDYTYANDGSYNVKLIVENVFGCLDSISQIVDVLVQPQAGFENNTVCAGDIVTFNDTSTQSPTTWEWDFGDGSAVDNNQHPSHQFTPGGIYDVTLIVGNPAGCMDTIIVPIDVYTVPIPDFEADTVCLFSITSFTDLTVDAVAIADWYWDFDDGNNSEDENPTYIFQAPGVYNVELIVVNVNGCDSSVTHPVYVSEIPTADFIADTVCMGNATTFTDVSTGIPTSWIWDFGDGNVSTNGPVVQHTYADPGTYIVSLFVSGGGNCTDQTFELVEVSDNVQAGITAVDTACFNDAIVFTDNSTITSGTIDSFFWDFGDGNTSTDADVSHTYDNPGVYTVTHTVSTAGGCTSTITMEVAILDLPVAYFPDFSTCQNAPTQFMDGSNIPTGQIATWIWDFGDGSAMSNEQNPIHIYNSEGTFNVSLTVISEYGCTDIVTLPTVVYPAPVADFTAPLACPDDTIQYTDLSTIVSGSIIAWEWDFDDGSTSVDQNPMHSFQFSNDSFYVLLVAHSNFGCTDTAINLIETYPFPTFQFGPNQAAGCQPLTVNFQDSSEVEGGIITNWEWTFGDGSASYAEDPIHIYVNDGSYYVGLDITTSHGCTFSDSLLYPIVVYPLPQADFNPYHEEVSINTPEVDFTDLSVDAILWEWQFGDGGYSNEVNPTHTYTDTGLYQVTQIVYSDFGCIDTAIHTINVYGEFAFFVPNAFTPNGDSKNNTWRAYGMNVIDYQMYVFNRWGEIVFETQEITDAWDGTYNGVLVQDDVYVWKVVLIDVNGDEHQFYGHVTVLK